MQNINFNVAFDKFIAMAYAHADNLQRPQDSQETWKKHAMEFCKQSPLTSSVEYILKEMIENPHLQKADIHTCRHHVERKGHCFKDPDLPKCSVRAAKLRREGNHLYVMKDFLRALEKYNESICCAPTNSEDLGIGYANRSAIYYEQKEYELALANIALAKRHSYPERLMPKLMVRESNCHEKLKDMAGKAKKIPTLTFKLEVNPRIPFLSKGISSRQIPIVGNGLVAEQDFKVGDVILHEKPLKTCVSTFSKFRNCNKCISGNLFHIIPCPNCTSAMFCNEECLQEGFKMHRFECGATAKLVKMNDYLLGPRMFFHGLTLFEDDLDKLMEFWKAYKKSDKSFFDLDYSKYDPLEEFKIFLGIKNRFKYGCTAYLKMVAAMYYTMF